LLSIRQIATPNSAKTKARPMTCATASSIAERYATRMTPMAPSVVDIRLPE
jgi:hypothetical protein